MANPYVEMVQMPSPDSVNTGLSALRASTMLELIGTPCNTKSSKCAQVTNVRLRNLLVSKSVGPFRVTGIRPAVEDLTAILAEVKANDAKHPGLYACLGTAGMLCARLVRGSEGTWSNHSWGSAVDITVGERLDGYGDGMTQKGLLLLYPYFKARRWYWGVEFGAKNPRREDSMHFEASDELMRSWRQSGRV